MIKINLKQKSSAPLNEVTTRYLRERFKLPEEFAQWVSTTYRENGDVLVEAYLLRMKQLEINIPTDAKELQEDFTIYYKRYGIIFDTVLKRYPAKKKELLDYAKQDYQFFLNYCLTLRQKIGISKDLERQIKSEFRENGEALIMIFSARYKNILIDHANKWTYFMFDTDPSGKTIDEVLKIHAAKKDELVNLAIKDYTSFSEEIKDLSIKEKEEIIIKLPHNYVWVNLKTSYCSREAKRMGHCGMAGYGGTLYSLRQILDDGTDEPVVTIEMNEKTKEIFQIKGGENRFPQEPLWPFIYEFFKHFDITELNIRERLALEDDQFMSYFDQSLSKTVEEQINYLRELASKSKEDNDWYTFVTKFGKFMNRNIDLTIEQYVELFDIYFFMYNDGRDPSNAIKTFFESYEPKLNMDFNIELVTKITDLLEERGRLTTKTISDLMYILVGRFNILISFKDLYKDDEKVRSAFQDLPILKRLLALYNAAEKEEKEKEEKLKMREHRKMISKAPFKPNYRGYFKIS